MIQFKTIGLGVMGEPICRSRHVAAVKHSRRQRLLPPRSK